MAAVGLLLLVIGRLGAELFLARISLPVFLSGAVVFLLGWHQLRALLLPLVLLSVAIPLPAIVVTEVSVPLQFVASAAAERLLNGSAVPVLRDGNVLVLPNATLQVAEACSGVRSLATLLALSILLARGTTTSVVGPRAHRARGDPGGGRGQCTPGRNHRGRNCTGTARVRPRGSRTKQSACSCLSLPSRSSAPGGVCSVGSISRRRTREPHHDAQPARDRGHAGVCVLRPAGRRIPEPNPPRASRSASAAHPWRVARAGDTSSTRGSWRFYEPTTTSPDSTAIPASRSSCSLRIQFPVQGGSNSFAHELPSRRRLAAVGADADCD